MWQKYEILRYKNQCQTEISVFEYRIKGSQSTLILRKQYRDNQGQKEREREGKRERNLSLRTEKVPLAQLLRKAKSIRSLNWCTQLRDHTKDKTKGRAAAYWESPVGMSLLPALTVNIFPPILRNLAVRHCACKWWFLTLEHL